MENKKDFLGNVISVGDTVVTTNVKYTNLIKGVVVKITEKQVEIKVIEDSYKKSYEYTRRFPNQMVVLKSGQINERR